MKMSQNDGKNPVSYLSAPRQGFTQRSAGFAENEKKIIDSDYV